MAYLPSLGQNIFVPDSMSDGFLVSAFYSLAIPFYEYVVKFKELTDAILK